MPESTTGLLTVFVIATDGLIFLFLTVQVTMSVGPSVALNAAPVSVTGRLTGVGLARDLT